jgi:hypothetical protein
LIFESSNKMEPLDFAKLLHQYQDQVYKQLDLVFPKFHSMELSLKGIEHALCEFQKYLAIHRELIRG